MTATQNNWPNLSLSILQFSDANTSIPIKQSTDDILDISTFINFQHNVMFLTKKLSGIMASNSYDCQIRIYVSNRSSDSFGKFKLYYIITALQFQLDFLDLRSQALQISTNESSNTNSKATFSIIFIVQTTKVYISELIVVFNRTDDQTNFKVSQLVEMMIVDPEDFGSLVFPNIIDSKMSVINNQITLWFTTYYSVYQYEFNFTNRAKVNFYLFFYLKKQIFYFILIF